MNPTHTDTVSGKKVRLVKTIMDGAGCMVDFLDGQGPVAVAASHLTPLPVNRPPAGAVRKPFYVLTRVYKANGDCVKGGREFATRKAQLAYIRNTSKAVTAYN